MGWTQAGNRVHRRCCQSRTEPGEAEARLADPRAQRGHAALRSTPPPRVDVAEATVWCPMQQQSYVLRFFGEGLTAGPSDPLAAEYQACCRAPSIVVRA